MIITFLGNDGSGKTTMAKEMSKYFEELGFQVFYKHEYQYSIAGIILKLLGNRKKEQMTRSMIVDREKSWKYQIWPLVVWFDILLQYAYFRLTKKGVIILLDRYIYDHLKSFEYLGLMDNSILKWLYLHFPRPDIPILFWVEPSIAYERKKESHTYDVSFYEQQLRRYLDLAERLSFYKINTNATIQSTKQEFLRVCLNHKKFRRIFITHCSKNRILDWALEQIDADSTNSQLSHIRRMYQDNSIRFNNTIKFLEEIPCPKLTIKTFKNFPNAALNDIDIVVSESDISTFLETVRNKGGDIVKTSEGKYDCIIGGLVRIEPHLTVSWEGVPYIDNSFLWNNPRNVSLADVRALIPNYEADLLVHAAHILFSNSFIRFSDYKYIHYLLANIPDLANVRKQALKYGWDKSLDRFLQIINRQGLQFPYFIPLRISLTNHLEKFQFERKQGNPKFIAHLKSVGLAAYWKLRYKITRRIPFDVSYD